MATVYAIGSNGSGQLGIGHKEDVSVPKEVLFGNHPINQAPSVIKAGGNHTLVVSAGQLYCSGDDSAGACGLLPNVEQPNPHFRKAILSKDTVPEDFNYLVTHIAATWEASIIVKSDSKGLSTQVYSFGTGNKGELGLGDLIFRSPKAQLIENFPPTGTKIIDLAASVSHVVAVISNGDVFGWGSGRKGQLGQPEGVITSPRKISGVDFKVERAVCGREFTYLLSSPAEGKHLILGTDKWDIKSSAPVEIKGWKDVGASWGGISVLLTNGKIVSWGRNDHGQLAPPGVPDLSHIAIGSEHTIALTIDGDVLAWGWGEHGNCGPSTVGGDVKDTWNVVASSKYLPGESRIDSIGSGCATSYICVSH
jgi:protein ATS1